MSYCLDLLKSLDMSVPEDDKSEEEVDVGVLSPDTIQKLQSTCLKRSLLETLNQAQSGGKKEDKYSKWGPVLDQKYGTRLIGYVNMIEKATNYKMKKNLVIPQTFKGKSFPTVSPVHLATQANQVHLTISSNIDTMYEIIEEQKNALLLLMIILKLSYLLILT